MRISWSTRQQKHSISLVERGLLVSVEFGFAEAGARSGEGKQALGQEDYDSPLDRLIFDLYLYTFQRK
jgi:hypothetical protein